jgi:hypothetical protein
MTTGLAPLRPIFLLRKPPPIEEHLGSGAQKSSTF